MVTVPAVSPPLDEITTRLLAFFRDTGRAVYDGAYGGSPVNPTFPHAILYSVPGGLADPVPDLDADYSTLTAAWQISAIAKVRNQAEQTARVFRDLLLGRTRDHAELPYTATAGWSYPIAAPDGWQITDRRPDPTLAGTIRTGDPPNAIFTAPFKFLLTITPA